MGMVQWSHCGNIGCKIIVKDQKMLRVNQIKIKTDHSFEQLKRKTAEYLHIPTEELQYIKIQRQSIDARRKPDVFYCYSVDVCVKDEKKVLKRFHGKENQVSCIQPVVYTFPKPGDRLLKHPIVIVGMGPTGLFCAYYLTMHGYPVVLLERGRAVEQRQKDVENFWKTGKLDPSSNVQFGEGGAGTFSDGKLNTLVKDKDGRNREVLETFVKFGAKEAICYEAKPHTGTDMLIQAIRNMRNEIVRNGGVVRFESQLTDIEVKNGQICGVIVNGGERIACEQVVLAIGHSARDTFTMLYEKGIPMEAKALAVGFRVEHPQSMINKNQYGTGNPGKIGAAPYKVTARAQNGRGVYSFCMCPGGYVVNASSEEGFLAVNGMSYSARDGVNANSAVIVSVTPEDYPSGHPLGGVEFQRNLERKAFELGNGKIPVQRYGAFKARVRGEITEAESSCDTEPAKLQPASKGEHCWTDLTAVLPVECNKAFVDGMEEFGRQIAGFDRPDAILSGVESRTSSPVRILRDEKLQSEIKGLYPCGEGAGYAGGITSAAMDGLRVAEMIAKEYCAE